MDIDQILRRSDELDNRPAKEPIVHVEAARTDDWGADMPNFKGNPWWTDFKLSMKVRDRLMLPKPFSDVSIQAEEIDSMFRARLGFIHLISGYLNEPPWQLGDIWADHDQPSLVDPELENFKRPVIPS